MGDTGTSTGTDEVIGNFGGRDTGSDADPLNGETLLLPKPKDKGDLEGPLTSIEVEDIDGDTNTWILGLTDNVTDLGFEGLGRVMTTTGEFNVITGIEGGSDKGGTDGGWGHTSHHERGLT